MGGEKKVKQQRLTAAVVVALSAGVLPFPGLPVGLATRSHFSLLCRTTTTITEIDCLRGGGELFPISLSPARLILNSYNCADLTPLLRAVLVRQDPFSLPFSVGTPACVCQTL